MATASKDKLAKFSELEGHDLLIPPYALRPSKRLRLTAALEPVINNDGVIDDGLMSVASDMMELLEDGGYVTDLDAWTDLYEKVRMEGMMELVIAYAGEAVGAQA